MVHTPKFLCCLIFCAIIDAVLRCFALICICAQASSTYVPSGVPKFLWTLCIFHLHHFPRAAHRHLQYFPGFCAPQNSKLHSGLRLSPQILNLIWHLSGTSKKGWKFQHVDWVLRSKGDFYVPFDTICKVLPFASVLHLQWSWETKTQCKTRASYAWALQKVFSNDHFADFIDLAHLILFCGSAVICIAFWTVGYQEN